MHIEASTSANSRQSSKMPRNKRKTKKDTPKPSEDPSPSKAIRQKTEQLNLDDEGSGAKQTKLNPNAVEFVMKQTEAIVKEEDANNWRKSGKPTKTEKGIKEPREQSFDRGKSRGKSDASKKQPDPIKREEENKPARKNEGRSDNRETANTKYQRKSNFFERNQKKDDNERKSSSFDRRNNRRSSLLDMDEERQFAAYNREFSERNSDAEPPFKTVTEITRDLFEMDPEYSLAHCVAEDMNMGSGIAVQFRVKFRRIGELLNQHEQRGGLAVLQDQARQDQAKSRFLYYLVTKRYSHGKPTYESLFSSLCRLKQHVIHNGVKKLAMPRIGCGLDRLEWSNVKFMLEFLFRDVDVEIVVCNLNPDAPSPQSKTSQCRVVNETYPIEDIEMGTVIVFFCSEDQHIFDETRKLDAKFHFLTDLRSTRKSRADIYTYTRNKDYVLCGCYVKKSKDSEIDFEAFQECLLKIQKLLKQNKFDYVGLQAVQDTNPCTNQKIVNVMRNILRAVDIYMCWPGELANQMPSSGFNRSYISEFEDSRSSFNRSVEKSEKTTPKNDSRVESWRTPTQAGPSHDWFENPSAETIDGYQAFKQEKIDHFTVVQDSGDELTSSKTLSQKMFYISESLDDTEYYLSDHFIQHIGSILNQRKAAGDVAVVTGEDNTVFYYLIVKQQSTDRLNDETLFSCVAKLKDLWRETQCHDLAGTKLKNPALKQMLEYCFRTENISIHLHNVPKERAISSLPANFKRRSQDALQLLRNIKPDSIVIYLLYEKQTTPTKSMQALDSRFQIKSDYLSSNRSLGSLVYTEKPNYVACGCFAKRETDKTIDYEALQKCISELKERCKTFDSFTTIYFFQVPNETTVNSNIAKLFLYTTDKNVLMLAEER